MKILDAEWTPTTNALLIKCGCGSVFGHWADRWKVKCPKCKTKVDLKELRQEYLEQNLDIKTFQNKQQSFFS